MMMRTAHTHKGFTLIEMLVAIAIFGILSILAYSGLRTILTTSSTTEQEMQRLQTLQQTLFIIGQDLRQAAQRSIRDEYGDRQAALKSEPYSNDLSIELSRHGYANPLQINRSHLLRVAYQIEDNQLYRIQWPALDRANQENIYKNRLADNIESIQFRFLQVDNEWSETWPAINNSQGLPPDQAMLALPVAIEVTLKLQDWGSVTRLYKLAGSTV